MVIKSFFGLRFSPGVGLIKKRLGSVQLSVWRAMSLFFVQAGQLHGLLIWSIVVVTTSGILAFEALLSEALVFSGAVVDAIAL